jgi:hypothetical protein
MELELGLIAKRVCHEKFRFFYCSGMTQVDLTALGECFMNPMRGYTLFVMGDDSLLIHCDGVRSQFIMGDFSQYDQTQDEIGLFDGRAIIYEALGFSDEVTVYKAVCEGKYHARMGPVHVAGYREPMQATGSADTTVWNSLQNVIAGMTCLTRYGEYTVESFACLGLEIKISIRKTFWGCDFLKGWWVPDIRGMPVWMPLPSMCLKLGKMIRDPYEIYGGYGGYCYALSCNIVVDEQYPILGPFMATIRRFAVQGRSGDIEFENPYKILPKAPYEVDRESVLGLVCERYELSLTQICEAEQLLASVVHMPVVVCSRAFIAMREADY